MLRENIADLLYFVVVAREKSFTRAAAQLGLSQSTLSHAMRGLETRLRVRLLRRTTRSVSLTDEGEHLLQVITPRLDEISQELENIGVNALRPAGNIRLTATELSAQYILWPKLKPFLAKYPEISVEIDASYGLVDIVAERFDAGIRLGEQVAKDMIAVRIGPDMRMAVVASPDYFKQHTIPQTPHDLTQHRCINLRLPTLGGLYAWEFEEEGREFRVRGDGQLTFNTVPLILSAVYDGFGIAYVPEEQVREDIANGTLIEVLKEYCPLFQGYYLFYPSRRQHSQAFSLMIEALRHRDG